MPQRQPDTVPAITVNDYYDAAHQSSWAHRSSGLMAGATLGAAYGAVIGAIASFIPGIMGSLGLFGLAAGMPAIGAVATASAVMAGIFSLMGTVAVSAVGCEAGGIAAGLAEKERREEISKLKDSGLLDASANPELHIKEVPSKKPPLLNWRVAVLTVPLLAAFGVLIGFNPVTAPLMISGTGLGSLGLTAGSGAAVAASASILGMVGIMFAMPQSYITNRVTDFYYKLLKGKLFTSEPEDAPEKPVAVRETAHSVTPDLPSLSEPGRKKEFSAQATRFSINGLIEKTEEHGVDISHIGMR